MKIELGDLILDVPECWDDCPGEVKIPLARLASFFSNPIKGELTEWAVWLEVMRVLFEYAYLGKVSTKSKAAIKWWKGLQLSAEQLEYIKDSLAWIKDKPDGLPISEFVHKGIVYVLPKERFKYTTSIEWTEGLLDFVELTSPPTGMTYHPKGVAGIDALDRLDCLIANFCRPRRKDLEAWKDNAAYNGDEREPFNRARAEERAKEFGDLDPGVKILVLWWYEDLLQDFFEEYKELFGSGKGKKNQRYADGRGFLMILKNAAKKHYLGDFDRVCDTDVNVVYSLLLDDFFDDNEVNIASDDSDD